MFHVATFGRNILGDIISNHNESQHETREDAEAEVVFQANQMVQDGYTLIESWGGGKDDAAEFAFRLKRDGTQLSVGLWEY